MRYIIALLLTSTAALAEVPRVVTDIPPVHSLTAAVMGDLGTPDLLLDRGASPHSFALRPSQAAAVADSDLVIWVGPQLTPWLESALANRPEGAGVLGLLAAKETHRRDFAPGEHEDHDAAGGEDHPEEPGHDDHDHDDHGHDAQGHDDHAEDDHGHTHTGTDPHAWLDPANGTAWLGLIADELSRRDPEHAAIYAANAAKAAAAIAAADAEAAATLAPVKDRPFVAFHDAYGYFDAHYGLTLAGTVALGDAASPGARHLAELKDKMSGGAVLCIYPEVQHDPALVLQMAEGTGVTVGGALDPSGSGMEPGPDLYPALLVSLARTLAACAP